MDRALSEKKKLSKHRSRRPRVFTLSSAVNAEKEICSDHTITVYK